ncbi:unnamed protein product [Callosobruchus maculatus]|uniref:Uncharacterized protein n=1 Tax=Callosobruchus maculatus TaxID=64391 RepID=A0A653DVM4_CALMS|nr:unnamed protein product [Callosobruchus maculatus]
MTVSLEGYLEPQRLSFSSPPNSELNPRPASPDDSFPVFSPPPYNHAPSDILVPPTASGRTAANPAPPYSAVGVSSTTTNDRRRDVIGPPWMPQNTYQTPRQSVISYSSRSPLSHHECNWTYFISSQSGVAFVLYTLIGGVTLQLFAVYTPLRYLYLYQIFIRKY